MNKDLIRKIFFTILCLILFYFLFILFIKVFIELPIEKDYRSVFLYKRFLGDFFNFSDRYGYGLHYINTILLFPFLLFSYFSGNLVFNGSGFDFVGNDIFVNNIILYLGKIISLFGLTFLSYYVVKIVKFFTKDKIYGFISLFVIYSNFVIIEYSSIFTVDLLLVGFLVGSLYYSILYMDKKKSKYMYCFIFFSLFAFIIKYQALMYIFWLYLILFIFILKGGNYRELGKYFIFFVIIFCFFNFNYRPLISAISQRFDLNSPFMSLNSEEEINRTYNLIDWVFYMVKDFGGDYGTMSNLVILFGIILFFIFLYKIKFKYLIILFIPIIGNYFAHFYVNILNLRHYLLIYSFFPIIMSIGFYFWMSFIFRNKFYIKIMGFILALLVFSFSFTYFNTNLSLLFAENKNELVEFNKLKNIINGKKIVFYTYMNLTIPYGLNYMYNSNTYCIENEKKVFKRFQLGDGKDLDKIYTEKEFLRKLESFDFIFFYNDIKKIKDLKSNFNIIYKGPFSKNNYYLLERKIKNEKNN